MKKRRNDRISIHLNELNIDQEHANPARNVALPENPDAFDALLIFGGIQSANDGETSPYIDRELRWLSDWLHQGKPTLGICLGAQMIAKCLGGQVSPHPAGIKEIGFHEITPTTNACDFLPQPAYFYQWHGEGFTLPNECELLATGAQFTNQAFRYRNNTYGIQFHPEVTRTVMQTWLESGSEMLHSKGVPSPERQLEDERKYGKYMQEWCRNLVDCWIELW